MAPKRNGSKIIRRFLGQLKREISVEKAILFGSYARGRQDKYSDIDIAIISPNFRKFKPIERLTLLGKIAWYAHTTEIEALGYTPQEYKNASKFDFLYEIKRTGREIGFGK